jgi:hypothetical protein
MNRSALASPVAAETPEDAASPGLIIERCLESVGLARLEKVASRTVMELAVRALTQVDPKSSNRPVTLVCVCQPLSGQIRHKLFSGHD